MCGGCGGFGFVVLFCIGVFGFLLVGDVVYVF